MMDVLVVRVVAVVALVLSQHMEVVQVAQELLVKVAMVVLVFL
jgi:hypothetical protein